MPRVTFDNSQVVFTRFNETTTGADFSLDISSRRQSDAQFVQPALASYGGVYQIGRTGLSTNTAPFVLDLPLLRDEDNGANRTMVQYFLANFYGDEGQWPGATLQTSADRTKWVDVASNEAEVDWGYVDSVLRDPVSYWRIDNDNHLDVVMVEGQPESVTKAEMLNGANAMAIIQRNGRVAIIQYQNVQHLGGNKYRLSTLLRGRRGTEALDTGYSGDESIVLLNTTDISRYELPIDDLRVTKYYRAVTDGQTPEDAEVFTHRHFGQSLAPYAPVHPYARYEGTTFTMGWKRQTRIGAESDLTDNVGFVPLAELSENYIYEILNSDGSVASSGSVAGSSEYSFTPQAEDGTLNIDLPMALDSPSFEKPVSRWRASSRGTGFESNERRTNNTLIRSGNAGWFLDLASGFRGIAHTGCSCLRWSGQPQSRKKLPHWGMSTQQAVFMLEHSVRPFKLALR